MRKGRGLLRGDPLREVEGAGATSARRKPQTPGSSSHDCRPHWALFSGLRTGRLRFGGVGQGVTILAPGFTIWKLEDDAFL